MFTMPKLLFTIDIMLPSFLLSIHLQLLSKPKYSCVEKIKTIGSTYMAAAGLQQAEGSKNSKQSLYYVGVLTDFAMALQDKLEQLNRQAFNDFKLRIGKQEFQAVLVLCGCADRLCYGSTRQT